MCAWNISNRNIYIPCKHTPQIVRTTYLIEMSYTQLCARRAQRNPFNLQSSPKCWLVLSNRNIYIPCTHTPQIVRTTYLIEMSYTQLCFVTFRTRMWFFPSVGQQMSVQIAILTEWFWTSGAFVRLLSCVSQHMRNQMFSSIEWFVALAAFVWLFSTVDFKCVLKETLLIYNHLQVLAWYIQSQHIYSTHTYSPNCLHYISNRNVLFQNHTLPNLKNSPIGGAVGR